MNLEQGCLLFDSGHYWEAHEAWEQPWLQLRGQPEADLYKALIHYTAAMVHLARGQRRGPRRLLRTSRQLLAPFLASPHPLDLQQLDAQIARLQSQVEADHTPFHWPPPPLPRRPD